MKTARRDPIYSLRIEPRLSLPWTLLRLTFVWCGGGLLFTLITVATLTGRTAVSQTSPRLTPAPGATGVNVDAPLSLVFDAPPERGSSGLVRIFDETTSDLVDTIDVAQPTRRLVIGGFSEGFNVYPIIVRDRTVTIYPRRLSHDRTYRVEIDPGVIVAPGFAGRTGATAWRFRTRARPAALGARVVVAADGSGDFNTVQGAVDAVPDKPARRLTIEIRNGLYEEIVYFRNKADLSFVGQDRGRVVIGYANNERFNGPPPGVPTNEKPDTFPYRRASFMADRSRGIHLRSLTLHNLTPRGGGQAEALLLSGGEHIVDRVTLRSFQDTVQLNDSVYVVDSEIEGETDFLWGRGPAFFTRTTLRQLSRTSPFMWVRSTAASHGFVFVACTFDAPAGDGPGPLLARNTAAYADSEVVLIDSRLGPIHPAAWSLVGDTSRQRYWEFNSRTLTGAPADTTQRFPGSRQLSAANDAAVIASYRSPAFVLGGWTPDVR